MSLTVIKQYIYTSWSYIIIFRRFTCVTIHTYKKMITWVVIFSNVTDKYPKFNITNLSIRFLFQICRVFFL